MIIIRTGNKQDYVGKQDKDRKENLMGLKKTATLLVMMLVLFTALDTRADEQRTGIYNTPAVNLRIMPSLTSLSLGLANKGRLLRDSRRNNSWGFALVSRQD